MWSFYFIVEFFCFHIDLCFCKYSFNVSIEVLLLLRNMHISNYEKSHKLKFKKENCIMIFHIYILNFPLITLGQWSPSKIKTPKQKKSCGAALSPIKMATNFQNSLWIYQPQLHKKLFQRIFKWVFGFEICAQHFCAAQC